MGEGGALVARHCVDKSLLFLWHSLSQNESLLNGRFKWGEKIPQTILGECIVNIPLHNTQGEVH